MGRKAPTIMLMHCFSVLLVSFSLPLKRKLPVTQHWSVVFVKALEVSCFCIKALHAPMKCFLFILLVYFLQVFVKGNHQLSGGRVHRKKKKRRKKQEKNTRSLPLLYDGSLNLFHQIPKLLTVLQSSFY